MSQIEKLQSKREEEEEVQLRDWFLSVDADESGKITAEELRGALMNGDWTRSSYFVQMFGYPPMTLLQIFNPAFDMETVKMLMGIYDTDRSGTIEFEEFASLWKYIKHWQFVFDHFDKDKSGAIDSKELEDAMHRLGYKLGPKALSSLAKKYAVTTQSKDGESSAGPALSFDRFLRCCVAVKTFSRTFARLDTSHLGYITKMDYDTFMDVFLSAP